MSRMPRGSDGRYIPNGKRSLGVLEEFVLPRHLKPLPKPSRKIRYSIPRTPIMTVEFVHVRGKTRVQGSAEVVVPGAVVAAVGGRQTKMVKILRVIGRCGGLTRAIFTFDLETEPSPSYTNRGGRRSTVKGTAA